MNYGKLLIVKLIKVPSRKIIRTSYVLWGRPGEKNRGDSCKVETVRKVMQGGEGLCKTNRPENYSHLG